MRYKLILLLLLLIPLAHAADTDKALDWLSQQPQPTISSLAFSILATDAFKDASSLKTDLNSKKSSENCWPKASCNSKDTALALLALKQSPSSNTWLSNLEVQDIDGKWVLQIDTDTTGTCTINYLGKTATINVNQGYISSTSCPTPTTQFDLNTCLEPNIISTNKEVSFGITCTGLGNTVISAAYTIGSLYIPIGEASPTLSTNIKIKNSYFLDFGTTLYANWAFKRAGNEPPSLVWLKKSYNSEDTVQNAILYLLTQEKAYIQKLLDKQTIEGSFGSLFETALAVRALRQDATEPGAISTAITWLDAQQSPDGSWAGSVEDTAAIIFGAYAPISKAPITTPSTTRDTCVANGVCEPEFGETFYNCPADCEEPEPTITEPEYVCGDAICDYEEDEDTCPEDCKESSFFFWFILLLFLALIGAGIYFYYTKFYKKGRNLIAEIKGIFSKAKKQIRKPIPKEITVPETPTTQISPYPIRVTAARKTKLEQELAKSLEEAKKVLKK